MKRLLQTTFILFGALGVTALGLDATDTLTGSQRTLLGQLVGSSADCPAGMVAVEAVPGVRCVDRFEAAAAATCPRSTPNDRLASLENLREPGCQAESSADREPWRFVTRDEAATLCLRAGKRLPSNAEWHQLALGTNERSCNVASGEVAGTDTYTDCVSAIGVHDAVGNVWEWTSDDVVAGSYAGRTLPESGYVQIADRTGLAVETGPEGRPEYELDYFWSTKDAVTALMRGGFYGSGSDAGVYSAHAAVALDFQGTAVGFRCVR